MLDVELVIPYDIAPGWVIKREDNSEPCISAQCRKDVHHAQRFLNANQRLWNRAGDFLRALFPRKYKMFIKYTLPKGLRRLAKPWDGMFIELGNKDAKKRRGRSGQRSRCNIMQADR